MGALWLSAFMIDRQRMAHQLLRRVGYDDMFGVFGSRALRRLLPFTLSLGQVKSLTDIVGFALGEPKRDCERIVRDFLYYRAITARRWAQVMDKEIALDNVLGNVVVEDEDLLQDFLQCQERGLIIATLHGGDYLSALLRMSCLLPKGRIMYVLRRVNGATRAANLIIPTLTEAVDVIEFDSAEGSMLREAVRALRHGNLLILLYDLPRSWGSTAVVRVFGTKLGWVRSPAELARLGRADVLPLSTRLTRRGECHVMPGKLMPYEDIDRIDILQTLADFGERQILKDPGQWHQWFVFPEMIASNVGG